MRPFSTYPEDRETLLSLARLLQAPGKDAEQRNRATDTLSDLVIAILEDEAHALAAPGLGLSDADQKTQGARCACRGVDDYCPCQNAPDRITIAARKAALTTQGGGDGR